MGQTIDIIWYFNPLSGYYRPRGVHPSFRHFFLFLSSCCHLGTSSFELETNGEGEKESPNFFDPIEVQLDGNTQYAKCSKNNIADSNCNPWRGRWYKTAESQPLKSIVPLFSHNFHRLVRDASPNFESKLNTYVHYISYVLHLRREQLCCLCIIMMLLQNNNHHHRHQHALYLTHTCNVPSA